MARSLATATVRPRGSKLAWATQLASMAPLALLLAAVMTYRPPATRARDLATSAGMDAFILAMDSFFVRLCARRVPASSIPCQTLDKHKHTHNKVGDRDAVTVRDKPHV